MSATIMCHNCGHPNGVPPNHGRKDFQCNLCGATCELTADAEAPLPSRHDKDSAAAKPKRKRKPARPQDAIQPAKKIEFATADEEPATAENSYAVVTKGLQRCPECQQPIEHEDVLCVVCGLDLRTNKKVRKRYEAIHERWDYGLAHATRLRLWLLCQAFMLVFGLPVAVLGGEIVSYAVTFAVSAVLSAFVLGTFESMDFKQNKKGKVQMFKTRRFGFIKLPPAEINVRSFDDVAIGRIYQGGILEWVLMFILLGYACLPGILWWYFVINRDLFYVALTRDHGNPDQFVYRGESEERMHEIAKIIRSVFLR